LISFNIFDIFDFIMRKEKSATAVTIRNIPAETHRALRVRAAQHGRSTEAEIRLILEAAVKPEGRVKLGSLLAQIGREAGGVDFDIERDRTPAVPVSLE
jgi:plasmid stability protein